ncbi:helix-turn-helix domain-containing protein [Saccharomonospora azurea]|uniref:helix-turn-helix domain-containing protein n=1 Tax=Saccharomonospora azurea TaxID=40988 RepID=UPI00023FF07A|nr:helix-turn-helix transcriptional regulator [Saccharomonospora azurea]EHK87799.1 Helix-turn-helix protein [Saccharomonospora azurea SZMC 14600]
MVEVSHVVAEWAFTQGLKKLREASENSNQSEIARRIGKSRATIGHYEMGRYLPSHDSLEIMLDAYGHGDRATYYRELRDRVEMHSPDWWEDEFPEHFPPQSMALLAGFEYSATDLRTFEPQHVPELLQTPAYAEALLRAELADHRADQLTLHLRMLRGRQAILNRADPPRIACVLGEAALRSPVGGPLVHGEQIAALVSFANRENVDIRVLPDSSGRPAGGASGFTELLLPPDIIQDFSDVVYVATPVDRIHYESPDALAVFRELWDRVWAAALPAEDSVELMADLARRLTKDAS